MTLTAFNCLDSAFAWPQEIVSYKVLQCADRHFFTVIATICIFEGQQCFIFDVGHLSSPPALIMMYHGARVVTANISQEDNNKCLFIAFPDIFLERENFGKYCDSLPLLNSAITNAVVRVTRAFNSHSA